MTESLLTLEEVLEAVNGIHVLGSGDFCFTSVETDSRNVKNDTLFVPLIGEFQDGHKYIPSAIEKGASVIFVCQKSFEADPQFFTEISLKSPEVFFILVENTMYALQNAAERYVEKFPSLVKIGVTGSSGKTTTKEILAALVAQKYKVITNKGNFNSETGLPLSVFNIREEHEVGIFEMGMNRENEIGEIAKVLKPFHAVVTNIGSAHIGILGSRENIAKEKSKVFTYINKFGSAIIPFDDDFAAYMADQVDGHVVYYGDGQDSSVEFVKDLGLEGTEFKINGKKIVLSLPGKYNYKNALGAIAMAKILGITDDQIADGINNLKPLFGRSEVLHGKYTIVQDCYNANPDSMEKAVEFVSSVTGKEQKILVLGDMLELGESSQKDHEKIGSVCAESHVDAVIFAGTEMKYAWTKAVECSGNKEKFMYFEGKTDEVMASICSKISEIAHPGDVILIKGSRGMGLERVTKLVEGVNA